MNLSLRLVQQWAHVCSPLLVRVHSPTYIRSLIERHYFDDYLKIIQLYVKHLDRFIKKDYNDEVGQIQQTFRKRSRLPAADKCSALYGTGARFVVHAIEYCHVASRGNLFFFLVPNFMFKEKKILKKGTDTCKGKTERKKEKRARCAGSLCCGAVVHVRVRTCVCGV